jgi:hypothetical protein
MIELKPIPGRWPWDTKVLVGPCSDGWDLVVEAPSAHSANLPLRSCSFTKLQDLARALYWPDPDAPLCALSHSVIVELCKLARISPATRTRAGYWIRPVATPEFSDGFCGWDSARHTFWLVLFARRSDAEPSYRFPDTGYGEEPISELARFLSEMHAPAVIDDETTAALARDQQGGSH